MIFKFDGCYHGHADQLLVSAGSGVTHLAKASSQGVPKHFVEAAISLPYNNLEKLETTFKETGNEIAFREDIKNNSIIFKIKRHAQFLLMRDFLCNII